MLNCCVALACMQIELFDLGGSKNIRRIWKTYLSEVHAVIYVVDAADKERFDESRKALEEVLVQAHLHDKPVLVFANKQDLPTAAAAADVATALGLTAFQQNRFNILGCTAKTPAGQQADARLREGLKWVTGQVNQVFTALDLRVKVESEVVKQEEARKKKEREEQARKNKEERLRRQQEQEAKAQAAQQEQPNVLANLPNQIESPSAQAKPATYVGPTVGNVPVLGPLGGQFSDLQRPDQGHVAITVPSLPPPGAPPTSLGLPPISSLPKSLAAQAPSTARSLEQLPPASGASRTSDSGGRLASSSVTADPGRTSSSRPSSRPGSASRLGPLSGPAHGSLKSSAALDSGEGHAGGSRLSNKVVPTMEPAPAPEAQASAAAAGPGDGEQEPASQPPAPQPVEAVA